MMKFTVSTGFCMLAACLAFSIDGYSQSLKRYLKGRTAGICFAFDGKDLPNIEHLSRYRFILAESILVSSQYKINMSSRSVNWKKVVHFYGDRC